MKEIVDLSAVRVSLSMVTATKSNHPKKLRPILKAAMWGGIIAAVLETVVTCAVVRDWGYSIGHPLMTDDIALIGLTLSAPAVSLEWLLGLDTPGYFNVYLTVFLNIILLALTFAAIASVWQFILRRKI